MGNSCCLYASSEDLTGKVVKDGGRTTQPNDFELPHISDREDLSNHPGTLFLQRSQSKIRKQAVNGISKSRRHTIMYTGDRDSGRGSGGTLRKSNSCSTIFIDDNTVSQPNLKAMLKCVSLAIYYHIKNRDDKSRLLDIFDEKIHPLSKDAVPDNYDRINPEHRHIYRFIKTLFSAAQLTAECAIITLVYIERLLTYGEIDLHPSNWKRVLLGGILLASKVWDDQAVWNVDYCQILRDITVEDMNELERSFLELLQFNINVPSSVYAKYYFDLRALAEKNELTLPLEPLDNDKARRLEAINRVCKDNMEEINKKVMNRSSSMDDLIKKRRSLAILS